MEAYSAYPEYRLAGLKMTSVISLDKVDTIFKDLILEEGANLQVLIMEVNHQ